MKTEQVIKCDFSTWYSTFKDVTVRSKILPLPEEFVKYLHADGIVLPEDCHGAQVKADTEWDSDDEELAKDWGGDEEPETSSIPQFAEFTKSVRRAIANLGGAVFPKLNWSSPKDATWITLNNSLRCESPADIYLLLKSSTFVAHDLDQPFDLCEDFSPGGGVAKVTYQLVLRRWLTIPPGSEFRCFVKNTSLIGICQRHSSSYYQHIHEEADDIIEDILTFYTQKISNRFPDDDYVFDVYRRGKGKVQLLDFNPFGQVTDGLLFTWGELLTAEVCPSDRTTAEVCPSDQTTAEVCPSDRTTAEVCPSDQTTAEVSPSDQTRDEQRPPAFRYVSSEAGIQSAPYRQYGVPQDFVDLSTGMDADKLVDFLQLQKIQDGGSDGGTSSDDDLGDVTQTCSSVVTQTQSHGEQGQGQTPERSSVNTTEAHCVRKDDIRDETLSDSDT